MLNKWGSLDSSRSQDLFVALLTSNRLIAATRSITSPRGSSTWPAIPRMLVSLFITLPLTGFMYSLLPLIPLPSHESCSRCLPRSSPWTNSSPACSRVGSPLQSPLSVTGGGSNSGTIWQHFLSFYRHRSSHPHNPIFYSVSEETTQTCSGSSTRTSSPILRPTSRQLQVSLVRLLLTSYPPSCSQKTSWAFRWTMSCGRSLWSRPPSSS
jgi:hypothetical protein